MTSTAKDFELYEKAIDWIKKRGYDKVKSKIDDFDSPTSFLRSNDREEETNSMTPDITAVMRGNKCYFEIAIKDDDQDRLVTKWKLLDRLAAMKEGKFFLFTPHGHRAFADRIIRDYEINAKLINI